MYYAAAQAASAGAQQVIERVELSPTELDATLAQLAAANEALKELPQPAR